MMFKYRDYVYNVYREGSFTKASEKMNISQPSLSAAIKKEEEIIGHPIFNRMTNPITLTDFGNKYLSFIQQIYDMETQLKNSVELFEGLYYGTLSVGAFNMNLKYFLPKTIVEFKQQFPNITLKVLDGNTIDIKQMLDRGDLDMIITSHPLSSADYDIEPLYNEQLILYIPGSFPINDQFKDKQLTSKEIGSALFSVPEEKSVSLKNFSGIPFILLTQGNYLRSCTDMLFQEAGFDPNIILEVDQSSVSLNFASYGLGATIFSNKFYEEIESQSTLCMYKLTSNYSRRTGFLCTRKGSVHTPAMQKFLEILRVNVI